MQRDEGRKNSHHAAITINDNDRSTTINKATGLETGIRLIYWNCFGFKNFMDITEHVKDSDIIYCTETWLISNKVSCHWLTDYNFVVSQATKEKSKGRAKGGLLIAYNKKI